MGDIYRIYTKTGGIFDIADDDIAFSRMPADRIVRDYKLTKTGGMMGVINDNLGWFSKNNIKIKMKDGSEVDATQTFYGEGHTVNAQKLIQTMLKQPIKAPLKQPIKLYRTTVETKIGDIPAILNITAVSKEEAYAVKEYIQSYGLTFENGEFRAYLIGLILAMVFIIALATIALIWHGQDVSAEISKNMAYARAMEAQAEIVKAQAEAKIEDLKVRGQILNLMQITKTDEKKDKNGHTIKYIYYADGKVVAIDEDTGKSWVVSKGSLEEDSALVNKIIDGMPNVNGSGYYHPKLPWEETGDIIKWIVIGAVGVTATYLTIKFLRTETGKKVVAKTKEKIKEIPVYIKTTTEKLKSKKKPSAT